jgi:hypothetical protein
MSAQRVIFDPLRRSFTYHDYELIMFVGSRNDKGLRFRAESDYDAIKSAKTTETYLSENYSRIEIWDVTVGKKIATL